MPFGRSTQPRSNLVIRVSLAIAFVTAIALYLAYVQGHEKARADAAGQALVLLQKGKAHEALTSAFDAQQRFGDSRALSRSLWAAMMARGGRHGRYALLRRTLAYHPQTPGLRLEFSRDSRFLAAIDGNTITVWNTETGEQVLSTIAGTNFVGFWRIGARYFGLLSSYQYYDLENSVIELPDGFRYAQPSKDALTAVAPGGDWAWRMPDYASRRTDYPIKLIDLHTSEKREVDIGYSGMGVVAVNSEATRVADFVGGFERGDILLWDGRERTKLTQIAAPSEPRQLYFSNALDALVVVAKEGFLSGGSLLFFDAEKGAALFSLALGTHAIADDLNGEWFAVQSGDKILMYRGANSPLLPLIAKAELSPAPATSH